MARYPARSASLVITLFGLVTNSILALQVLAASRSINWELESEWETSGDRIDSVKIVWGLLVTYFTTAAIVCTAGFIGVVKNKQVLVRCYRDYSIADFVFCLCASFAGAYSAFRQSTREGVCEELSRQPELMRDMVDMGLSMENCERWFERTVMAFVAIMVIVNVARLHFLLAVSNYYSYLTRYGGSVLPSHSHSHSRSHSLRSKPTEAIQRIYLLPRSTATSGSTPLISTGGNSPSSKQGEDNCEGEMIYAPVPLHELSPEMAQDLRKSAREAWITRDPASATSSSSSSGGHHSRSHSHSHRHGERTGRISLPIVPDEGLFPSYKLV